jgi:YD repeat-containing protein
VYQAAFPLSVAVKVRPAGTTAAATPLTEQRYYYDGLGRLTQQKDTIPHNDEIPNSDWAARNTEYDVLDRVLKAFEPVPTSSAAHEPGLTSSAFTAYTYDPFGRVRTTTAPDGAQTTINYVGSRVKTIQSFLATPANPNAPVTTTERYDGAGRLIAVEQPTGPTTAASPTGATVKTEYRYDPADRLVAVAMRGAEGPVQQRLFDYDGRGFLRWESQPESGLTSYTYDARGHVRSKQQSAADTPFDLDFTYDGAERLLQVHGRNPFASVSGEPGSRILKLFEYGDANITSGGVTDRRKGKLVAATRFNYSDVAPPYLPGHPSQRDLAVKDTYFYKDAAGRRTDRITTISTTDQLRYDYPVVLREISTSISYDDLDLPQNVKYPMCVGCGGPESDPERQGMLYGYEKGRLTSITGFVNDISYWPNGLRNVLVHSNLIADTQQVSNMPRPSEISFGIYDRCVPPAIVTQPTSQTLTGSSTTLSVTMSGTGPFHYTWYDDAGGQIGTTQSVTVSPTVTTRYFVEVSTPCGILTSDDAIVSVGECPLPELGTVRAIAQPDGSWILGPDHPIGEYPSAGIDGPSVQYEWRKLPSSTVVGTQRTLAVSSVTATTTWSLTVIVQNCGTDTANITIDVPPAMPTNLAATYLPSPTRISIAWTAIPGATYQVERRSGPVWLAIGTSSSGTFLDQTVAAPQTYAYRVKIGDRYSNADVATTTSFTPVVVGQIPNAAHAESLRNAVNYVRGAAGWPALSWSAMLPASDFLPSPGNKISTRHVESCRARINEALQALGVPLQSYTTPFLSGAVIQAVHFNEIQDRAK